MGSSGFAKHLGRGVSGVGTSGRRMAILRSDGNRGGAGLGCGRRYQRVGWTNDYINLGCRVAFGQHV